MNKIYRSVYNESLKTWVAVSEIEGQKGKTANNVDKRETVLVRPALSIFNLSKVLTALLLTFGSVSAFAAGTVVSLGDNPSASNGAVCTTNSVVTSGSTDEVTWNCMVPGSNNGSVGLVTFNGTYDQAFAFNDDFPSSSVSMGDGAKAVTGGSIAIGKNATAGRADMADPQDPEERPTVGKRNNIAIGDNARADGGRVISIGESAGQGTVDNWNIQNVNIGTLSGANSKRDYSVAIGFESGMVDADSQKMDQKDGYYSPSVYIGKRSGKNNVSYGNIALGNEAGSSISDDRVGGSIMIGNSAGEGSSSNDGVNQQFTTFGSGANTFIGQGAGRQYSGDGTIAIGNLAGQGWGSTTGAQAKGDNNIFMGHLAGAGSDSGRTIIIGTQAGDSTINDRGVLIGNFANSPVKTATRNVVSIGSSPMAYGWESIAVGFNAAATANNSVAIGRMAKAGGPVGSDNINAIAIGTDANATGSNSIATGYDAEASGKNSIASGFDAKATGENAIAIGTGALATGSLAQGAYSKAGNGGAAFGDYADAGGTPLSAGPNVQRGTALGTNAVVQVDDGIALGSHSLVTRGPGEAGYDILTQAPSTDESSIWKATHGAVSVGSEGPVLITRQITNVAAGSRDTDAVNVAQLKRVSESFNESVNVPLHFAGDISAPVSRQLGQTLKVVGGITDPTKLSENNIGVVADATEGSLTIKLAKDLTADSITINNGGPVINNVGINMNETRITNMGDAINDTDAVTYRQLKEITVGNVSLDFAGNEGQFTAAAGSTVNIKGGDKRTDSTYSTTNVTTVANGNEVSILMADAPIFTGGVTVSNHFTVNEGTTIDMGGNKVTNVADGQISKGSKDAINGGQIYNLQQNIGNQLGNLRDDLNKVDRNARAGSASAGAIASLPQAYLPGKSMFAVATAGYRGQQGYAAGLSTVSDNGKWIIKGAVSGNSRGHVMYGVGAGYQW